MADMAFDGLPVGSTILTSMSADEPATEQPAAATAVNATASPDSGSITIDVACPGCGYNLRGLAGPIVDCPECGLRSDVPELASRQWDKPWYRAPGFNTLGFPAVLMFFGWIWAGLIQTHLGLGSSSGLIFLMIGIVGWCLLMANTSRVLGWVWGLGLALVMHVLLIGYLACLLGGMGLVIWGALQVLDGQTDAVSILWWVLWFAILIGVFWGCRRAERAIAMVCIRHYLLRRPTQ